MASHDEYVTIYGANPDKTGKADYASFGADVVPVFGKRRKVGLR